MKLLNKKNDKGWFTLVEMVIVVSLIIILIYALYPKFAGYISKQKDLTRIKVLQEISTYYEWIMQSTWSYPNGNMKNSWWSGLRSKAKLVWTWVGWANWAKMSHMTFTHDGDGNFDDPELVLFSDLMVASWILSSASDMKILPEGEDIKIFTSKTWKRMVGCVKLYWENATASEDWDWIPDDKDPDGPDWDKNGSRIYVMGDMKLWQQISGTAIWECQDLIDPRTL